MSNLKPELRIDKNGKTVTRHVKQESPKVTQQFPIPHVIADDKKPSALPISKQELKELDKMLYIAREGNASKPLMARFSSLVSGKDYRMMSITFEAVHLDNGEFENLSGALSIIDTRVRLELGDDEEVESYLEKIKAHEKAQELELTYAEDYDLFTSNENGDNIVRFVDENAGSLDEIKTMFEERGFNDQTTYETLNSVWNERKNSASHVLREGTL